MTRPFIHKSWINHPSEATMTTVTLIDRARQVADDLEAREQRRNGGSRSDARARLARRLRVLPGTLYNLARNCLKKLDAELRDRLTAAAVRDLQSEIASLNNALDVAHQMGLAEDHPNISKIKGHLASAQALFSETKVGERP
jgi:hypothetical protein